MLHYRRTTCRICDGNRLARFLSLGPSPLANSFLHSEAEFGSEATYPLDVYFCETCSLVQLLDVIDPEVLFRDYIYVSGTSDTLASHNRGYARGVVERLGLVEKDLVVEVASNDGSLLRCFQPYAARTLGIEPATNIARMAQAAGVETINTFFRASVAEHVRQTYGPAKAVIGNNVLAHVDETRDFLSGCEQLLAEDGLVIFEVPYLRELISGLEYDTIYHEHLCYFSISPLLRLCEVVGLAVNRIEFVPIHGGSLRVYAGRVKNGAGHAAEVLALCAQEAALGIHDLTCYERFATDVAESRRLLVDMLESLTSQGKVVAGYGAPAKGNTLLNFCRIDTQLLPYTVDKSPLKVGTFTPGMHIPVLPVSSLVERRPDFVLILAWNFANEIVAQQQAYLQSGGRFISPNPRPRFM